MNLQDRIDILLRLREYIVADEEEWKHVKQRAFNENSWFLPEFIDVATRNIANHFLEKDILKKWTDSYQVPPVQPAPRTVGIVMAGNIPLVGFHDMLCVFISGHKAMIKPSSKDQVLIRHLVAKLAGWNNEVSSLITFSDMLKGCDAYIATGSNNSASHFEYYFRKYPHIIRRNKTSVAVLSGNETTEDLLSLADDVYLYFGLGCRNVTKLYVPEEYDFVPLLSAFKKYNYLADEHKYKNNYDYNLALHILNKKYYMSNESLLLIENSALFSPISQLNYEFYSDRSALMKTLNQNPDIQCIAGPGFIPFGSTQTPSISDYADGIDTMQFLLSFS
jgi:hypothetical protein